LDFSGRRDWNTSRVACVKKWYLRLSEAVVGGGKEERWRGEF
jgi:hypothetical protein